MTSIVEIEQSALRLPLQQRVRLVEALLDSLSPEVGEVSEAAELEEAVRRDREIESGQVKAIPEGEFWSRVEKARERERRLHSVRL